MITNVNQKTYDLRGLSTDTKPVNNLIGNGSTYFEMDTGDVFIYDEQHKTWIKV